MQEINITVPWEYKLEKTFTTAWLKELTKKWYTTDKISDWSIWAKKVDCYIFTDQASYICEVKIIKNDIFKISQLRDNQKSFLKRNLNLNWKPIVCVYSISHNKYKIIPYEFIVDKSHNDRIKLQFD